MPNSGRRIGRAPTPRRRAGAPCPAPWAAATTRRRASRAKRAQPLQVLLEQRLEVAQHQRRDVVSPTASSICGSRSRARIAPTSSRSGSSSVADVPRQDVAAADVGDVARLALVEADQHRALLRRRGAPTAGPAADSPRPALRSAAAPARAGPCRDARARLRARAASSPPARRRAGAAARSRRRRRSAGSAARRAARSRRRSATSDACSQLFLRRRTATCTSSPGSASSTNTTLPSALCATPCASRSSDSIRSHSSVLVMAGIIRAARRAAAKLPVARRELRRGAAEGADGTFGSRRTLRHQGLASARESRRSSLERGPFRAGPPKGQAVSFAAPPISQVERTARANDPGRLRRHGRAICSGAAMTPPIRRQPRPRRCCTRRCMRCTSSSARRWCRSPATTMPVSYPQGILAEHRQCRESAVLFDVSHMGQLRLIGDDAAAALETLVPVDIVGLAAGQAALRPLHQRRRRHPRRPDGDAARRPPVPGRQRRLQGRRHRAPARPHRPPLPDRAAARPRAARAAGAEGRRRAWRASHPSSRSSPS